MGFLRVGLLNQFTGFDFLFTVIGLLGWVWYITKKDNGIAVIMGKNWRESKFKEFLAQVFFKGWLFFGGLILGIFPDYIWVGIWKTALLVVVLFVIYTKRKNKEQSTVKKMLKLS